MQKFFSHGGYAYIYVCKFHIISGRSNTEEKKYIYYIYTLRLSGTAASTGLYYIFKLK